MKRTIISIIIIIVLLSMMACGKKKVESKNLEQLHKEQGVPVRIKEVQPSVFSQTLSYNATLTGIEESMVKSMVSDVVASINVKVGDYVKKDKVIMSFPHDTPAAQYQQASSAFQNARTTYERMQRLFAQGAISQQDMDNVETGYKVAKANLGASDQMVNVRAPISGYITTLAVNVGDHVPPGAELFTVSNTSKYKAVIWVPDSEIKLIKKGQKATAKWNGDILNGYVSSIALSIDSKTKAFRTEVVFNRSGKISASGVTAEINLEVLKINNALVVDRKSIVETTDKKFIWIVQDNKATRKEITTKNDNGIEYEVISGLAVGDKLITEGITLLSEGCLIQVMD